MSLSSAPGGARCGRRDLSTARPMREREPSVNTRNVAPLSPVIPLPPSMRSAGAYAIRWSGAGDRTGCAPAARRRSVSADGKSSAPSGMRRLSPAGEDAAEPEAPVSVSHSSAIPCRNHAAASAGEAETKSCCHALVRLTANVRSQTMSVASAGQSAAKPPKSFQETSEPSDATTGSAAAFAGFMPPRIFAASVKPVPSRFVAVLNALVPPNQRSSQASGIPSPSRSAMGVAVHGSGSEPSTRPSPSVSRTSGSVPATTSSPSGTPSRSVSRMSGSVWWTNSSSRSERPSPSQSGSSASSAESGWNASDVTFVGSELVVHAGPPSDAPTRMSVSAPSGATGTSRPAELPSGRTGCSAELATDRAGRSAELPSGRTSRPAELSAGRAGRPAPPHRERS